MPHFLQVGLNPPCRQIIEYCLAGGSVENYVALLPISVLEEDN